MNYLCRLCSTNKNLVDVFHSALEGGSRLRYCILLASGIDIKRDDSISTMVCHRCCEIAVKLHKYRINAITNDKLLKQKYGQPYEPPIVDPKELMKTALELDEFLMKETDLDVLYLKTTINPTITGNIAFRLKSKITDKLNANQSLNLKNNDVISSNNCDMSENIANISIKHDIDTHPSVIKLLTEHKNIILPMEVYGDDVSPLVSLDTNDLNKWYANQISTLKDKLIETVKEASIPSFAISESSTDSDSFVVKSRLRKRTNRRVIIDSDSEDDPGIPRKVPKKVPVLYTSHKTTDHVTAENSASVFPLNTTNTIETNLKSLFTDFNKYGINIEDSEPPIESPGTQSPILVEDNSEVICLTDEEQAPNEIANSNSSSSNIDLDVKSLFEKYYSFNCKPKNTAVHLNHKGMIVLQNMVPELNKYAIPVEIQYSHLPVARFLKRDPPVTKNVNANLWSYKDCTDIINPTGQIVNADTVTNVNETPKTTKATTSKPAKIDAPAVKVVSSSSVPNNSVLQPLLYKTTGHLASNKPSATPTFTQAPTTGTVIQANSNIYNVVPVIKEESNNVSSNINNNVVTDTDLMPPLIPITRPVATSVPTLSNRTIPLTIIPNNGNNQSKVQVKFCTKRTLVTEPKLIRKILPKIDASSSETSSKSFDWHKVQTSEPSPVVPPTLTPAEEEKPQSSRLLSLLCPSSEIKTPLANILEQPPIRPPSIIRVKSLSELIKK